MKKLSVVLSGMLLISAMHLTAVSAEGTPLAGDMNLDNTVSISDIVMMYKYLHGKQQITQTQFLAGDVNQDGKINIFDFVETKQSMIQDYCKEIPFESVQYFSDCDIDHYYENQQFPFTTKANLLQSPQDLQNFCTEALFAKVQSMYDANYFETHDLLAVPVWEGCLGYFHKVTAIQQDAGKNWNIQIFRKGQECMEDAEEVKVILIPTDKSAEQVKDFRIRFDNQEPNTDLNEYNLITE